MVFSSAIKRNILGAAEVEGRWWWTSNGTFSKRFRRKQLRFRGILLLTTEDPLSVIISAKCWPLMNFLKDVIMEVPLESESAKITVLEQEDGLASSNFTASQPSHRYGDAFKKGDGEGNKSNQLVNREGYLG